MTLYSLSVNFFSKSEDKCLYVFIFSSPYHTNFWVPFWSALGALQYLNLSRCHITDDGSEQFSGKILQESLVNCLPLFFLAFSPWPYPSLAHLLWKYWTYDGYFFTGLGALKILNLGFNDITDECLVHLKGVFTAWNSIWIHFNASFCISLMSMKLSAHQPCYWYSIDIVWN